MESWPAFDPSIGKILGFTVMIDQELTSMTYRFSTFLESGSIDWGDGTIEQIHQRQFLYNTHEYGTPGIYHIQVTGTLLGVTWALPAISPVEKSIMACLVSVDTPIPDIPSDKLPYVVDAIYTTSEMFAGCSNLVYVHPRLFRAYTRDGVTFCPRPEMFSGCRSLEKIPPSLFRGVHIRGMLPGGTLTEFSLQGCFNGCTSLTDIPDGLFDNPWFEDCESIKNLFSGCVSLKHFPDDLFSGLESVINCAGAFENCYSITKNVPPLWDIYPNANGINCFRNCVNAANYNAIPPNWK